MSWTDIGDVFRLDFEGFKGLFRIAEPNRSNPPNAPPVGNICLEPCQGGTFQTTWIEVEPTYIKRTAIFLDGLHVFQSGGVGAQATNTAKLKLPQRDPELTLNFLPFGYLQGMLTEICDDLFSDQCSALRRFFNGESS